MCCQSLSANEIYKPLDRGDGVCKYYNEHEKLCSIYNDRPIICNVDKFYEIELKDKIDREKYYMTNYAACEKLKRNTTM